MSDMIDKVKTFLRDRSIAYQITFNKESRHANAVLKDLARFCRAADTTFHTDPRVHAILEGRREVWLRIQNHLNLTPEEIWELNRKE